MKHIFKFKIFFDEEKDKLINKNNSNGENAKKDQITDEQLEINLIFTNLQKFAQKYKDKINIRNLRNRL